MNAKKVWDITSTVLVILAVLFAVLLMGARLLGFRVYNIISGSMEPVYNRGDLVYVQPVKNISQLKVGDVISYVQNEELVVVTHRIVRIDPEQNRVHTKGETNDTEDPPVHFNNVIGLHYESPPSRSYRQKHYTRILQEKQGLSKKCKDF